MLHDDSVPSVPEPMHVVWHGPPLQVIAPHAALPPEQVDVHEPLLPVQLIVPHAALPAQVALQSPPLQLMLPHAPLPPEQFAVQSPVPQLIVPHASVPVHVALQSPLVHVTLPHAFVPVQSILQSFVLQVIPRHASFVVQSISHDAALPQLIVPHAPADAHTTLQFQFGGHAMLPLPVPVIVHVIAWKSHVPWQIVGHTCTNMSGMKASTGRLPMTQ